MAKQNHKQSTRNGKKGDGKFRSKHVGHDRQAESARTVFGLNSSVPEESDEPNQ